jgi:hypothetical protein
MYIFAAFITNTLLYDNSDSEKKVEQSWGHADSAEAEA